MNQSIFKDKDIPTENQKYTLLHIVHKLYLRSIQKNS